MKKFVAFLLVAVLALACTAFAIAEEEPMTFEDFMAAEVDDPVVVESYVQLAAYNPAYGNVCLFLADPEGGAYYAYRAPCDDALAAQLTPGTKVRVAGFMSDWQGEVEIVDCEVTVLEGEPFIAEPIDITAELASDTLIEKLNRLVTVKDATVAAYNDAGDAFSYAWDGSGQAGANSDLYFNIQVGDAVYAFMVESDEFAEGTEVYTAVTNLKVGDVVDVTGFLYWYNGAQVHVTAVTVK